ncbi:hypothetical protein E2562_012433 [Oryza meyeriana var. granulata]|uniref:Uncharacterized protein n=1 Tax=Oryza meyeriana var. granulata TaxID=110450 RepID=A0A6G1C438_9ORYZ|nr:hypothetical protein E2562_012433 [Oryza meyeriana var. granulata]
MSLSSYLTCNLVQRGDPYVVVDSPQPQTATCCTALHRADGRAQPRYAPLRTPGSTTTKAGNDDKNTISSTRINDHQKQQVRKCKSTVEEVDIEGPRLRRSGGVRRDWSFEDLRAAA